MLLGNETPPAVETPAPAANQVRLVEIDNGVLRDILHLPAGAVIEGYDTSHSFGRVEPSVVLRVRHPDFSPVVAGLAIPYVKPQYRACDDGRVEFVTWHPAEKF